MLPKPSPELTWSIIQFVWWSGIAFTVYCNYADCKEATISAVMASKAAENYWIPAVIIGLIAHWWWPCPR